MYVCMYHGVSDLDECLRGVNDSCSPHATCTNLPGCYNCTCREGYTGDGIRCHGQSDGGLPGGREPPGVGWATRETASAATVSQMVVSPAEENRQGLVGLHGWATASAATVSQMVVSPGEGNRQGLVGLHGRATASAATVSQMVVSPGEGNRQGLVGLHGRATASAATVSQMVVSLGEGNRQGLVGLHGRATASAATVSQMVVSPGEGNRQGLVGLHGRATASAATVSQMVVSPGEGNRQGLVGLHGRATASAATVSQMVVSLGEGNRQGLVGLHGRRRPLPRSVRWWSPRGKGTARGWLGYTGGRASAATVSQMVVSPGKGTARGWLGYTGDGVRCHGQSDGGLPGGREPPGVGWVTRGGGHPLPQSVRWWSPRGGNRQGLVGLHGRATASAATVSQMVVSPGKGTARGWLGYTGGRRHPLPRSVRWWSPREGNRQGLVGLHGGRATASAATVSQMVVSPGREPPGAGWVTRAGDGIRCHGQSDGGLPGKGTARGWLGYTGGRATASAATVSQMVVSPGEGNRQGLVGLHGGRATASAATVSQMVVSPGKGTARGWLGYTGGRRHPLPRSVRWWSPREGNRQGLVGLHGRAGDGIRCHGQSDGGLPGKGTARGWLGYTGGRATASAATVSQMVVSPGQGTARGWLGREPPGVGWEGNRQGLVGKGTARGWLGREPPGVGWVWV